MKHSLKRECLRHLRDTFGLADYRPGQRAAAEALLSGRDVMCILPTGAGKSLCWQLPALVHEGLTVVVSPLIALMRDQVQHLERAGIPVASLDSLMSPQERMQTMARIRKGETRIVLVAPERLEQPQFRQLCGELSPWLVVVDEAHCIIQWGEEFRPAYRNIGAFLKSLCKRPVLCAMTATADNAMQRVISQSLGMRREKRVILPHIRENLAYDVRTTLDAPGEILRLCRDSCGKTVVFCGTRAGTQWLAEWLRRSGIRAAHYHAGMARQQRMDAQDAFRSGELDVLCATSAFGMGVDIPDIRRIIHESVPDDLIDYIQQSGRAGRDGLPAECILLLEPNELLVKARRPRSAVSGMGFHPIRKRRYLRMYWCKLEKLLRVMLASRCITAAMAEALGHQIPPCGMCSACRKGRLLKRIPSFRHMREWEIRLWFLQWQRDKMARRMGCPPAAVLPDSALNTAARTLVFPGEKAAPDELARLLAHFRGEKLHTGASGWID